MNLSLYRYIYIYVYLSVYLPVSSLSIIYLSFFGYNNIPSKSQFALRHYWNMNPECGVIELTLMQQLPVLTHTHTQNNHQPTTTNTHIHTIFHGAPAPNDSCMAVLQVLSFPSRMVPLAFMFQIVCRLS